MIFNVYYIAVNCCGFRRSYHHWTGLRAVGLV